MLIDTFPRTKEKRLSLFLRDEPLRRVLAGLLEQWGYSLENDPADAHLLLAEDGFPLPGTGAPVLRLTPSPSEEGDRLSLPLSLEKLWAELESRFHRTPRSRIRITLDLPAKVDYRNRRDDIRIVSLSDLGCRFDLGRELVVGEELLLHLALGGRRFRLAGEVIYAIPGGEIEGYATQIGVMFDYREKRLRKFVHDFIIRTLLERVGEGMAGDVFRGGLSRFDLPAAVQREIGT